MLAGQEEGTLLLSAPCGRRDADEQGGVLPYVAILVACGDEPARASAAAAEA